MDSFDSQIFDKLEVYVYDFLKKKGLNSTAQSFLAEAKLSPHDTVIEEAPGGYLLEWWKVFWEIYLHRHNVENSDVAASHLQERVRKAAEERNRFADEINKPAPPPPQQQSDVDNDSYILDNPFLNEMYEAEKKKKARNHVDDNPLSRNHVDDVVGQSSRNHIDVGQPPSRNQVDGGIAHQSRSHLDDVIPAPIMKSKQLMNDLSSRRHPFPKPELNPKPSLSSSHEGLFSRIQGSSNQGGSSSAWPVHRPGPSQHTSNPSMHPPRLQQLGSASTPSSSSSKLEAMFLNNRRAMTSNPFSSFNFMGPRSLQYTSFSRDEQDLILKVQIARYQKQYEQRKQLQRLGQPQGTIMQPGGISNSILGNDYQFFKGLTNPIDRKRKQLMSSPSPALSSGNVPSPFSISSTPTLAMTRTPDDSVSMPTTTSKGGGGSSNPLMSGGAMPLSTTPQGGISFSKPATFERSMSMPSISQWQSGAASSLKAPVTFERGRFTQGGGSSLNAPMAFEHSLSHDGGASLQAPMTFEQALSSSTMPQGGASSKAPITFEQALAAISEASGGGGDSSKEAPPMTFEEALAMSQDADSSNQPWKNTNFLVNDSIDDLMIDPENVDSFLSEDANAGDHPTDVSTGIKFKELSSAHASLMKVTCCHFSSDGKLLASGSHDNKVILWQTDKLRPRSTIEEHMLPITDVRFSPNMAFLATSSFDRTVRVFNVDNPSCSDLTFTQHSSCVMSLDFHPTKDDILCSCDADGEVRFWSIEARSCYRVFKGASKQVRFQPQHGRYLAAAAENVLSIFDAETCARQHLLKGHENPISSICWDPSGEMLASVSEDSVRVWTFKSGREGECLHVLGHSGNKFHSCAFYATHRSPLLLIGCYETLEVWNVNEKRTMSVAAHKGLIASLAVSTTTGLIASASHDKTIKLWK